MIQTYHLACLTLLLFSVRNVRASLGQPLDNLLSSAVTKNKWHQPNNDDVFTVLRGGSRATPPVTSELSAESTQGIRVAYQGEPGAYSEKATRELLGEKVTAIGRPSFEACFRAVASMECDYACLPIENSLGGSIHENYDLMLRYDVTIVAEHEFRVNHCLLVKPGVKRENIKYAISHPQALAQCDNFLRGLGITPIPTYDTAGSAKMISEGGPLPDKCTPENTAAIASDLAGRIYKLTCLDASIEDDDTNFTRFLLLGRKSVAQYLTNKIPTKTSIVFTLPDSPGALYKALACFALRDIDCTKIESRPTSASLLNFLKFRSQQAGHKTRNKAQLPRFRYCFYLDFLANQLDENTQNALSHLREQADFMRNLGSYPQRSKLVGPVSKSVEALRHMVVDPSEASLYPVANEGQEVKPLNIGFVGFGSLGQFLARKMALKHRVSCFDKVDRSEEAHALGVEFFGSYDSTEFLKGLDVVVLAVPLIEFEETAQSLSAKDLKGKLVVEMSELNSHPKTILLREFGDYTDVDLVTSHGMFGASVHSRPPATASGGIPFAGESWDGRPIIFEKIRVSDVPRFEKFLKIFEDARCHLVEMNSEQHDESIADAQFVTYLTGRLLCDKQLLPPTPVISKEYAALNDVADMTSGDSFDLFFGMFKYNDRAKGHLSKLRENLARIERQLAAREAYLEASSDLRNNDRQRLLAETRKLLHEVVNSNHSQTISSTTMKDSSSTVMKVDETTKPATAVIKNDSKKKSSLKNNNL